MKSEIRNIVCAAVAVFALSGCISYEYTGEKEPPVSGEVRVYADSARIQRRYTVLGQATVSGSYQDVSRDRMIEKLTSEAKKCGADAVLVIENQVVPVSEESTGGPGFMTAFDYDDTNRSWNQIYRDVDQNFTNTSRARTNISTGVSHSYKRVIRAEFLRYVKDAAAQPKP